MASGESGMDGKISLNFFGHAFVSKMLSIKNQI